VDLTKYVEHHEFSFDDVLDEGVSNDAVYRSTVQPLVATIFRAGKVGPFTGTICFDTARQGLGHAAGD
jgi:kinesin family protein 2/24